MEIMDAAREYIYPELLALPFVLYGLGVALKTTTLINDKLIPLLLNIAGVALAGLYMASITDVISVQNVCAVLLAAVVQGVLCASAAVMANQLYKQAKK